MPADIYAPSSVIIIMESCDHGSLCSGLPISFAHNHHVLDMSLSSHSHLCHNPLQGAKAMMPRLKILAATVRDIMAKARSIAKLSQMISKGLSACLCLFYAFS